MALYDKVDYKGNCRTFFSSVDKLSDYEFNDKTKSAKVWKIGFKGVILHDKPFNPDWNVWHKGNNEFYLADEQVHKLEESGCVSKDNGVESVEMGTNVDVVLYEGDNVLYVTESSGNLPSDKINKATHVKVCPKTSSACLKQSEKNLKQSQTP